MTYEDIQHSTRIALFTHINPDGDALGSTLALMAWLDSLGKDVRLFIPSIYAESLAFMVESKYQEKITVWDKENEETIGADIQSRDLLIGLDFNTLDRIGAFREHFCASHARKLLIDHHVAPQADAFDSVSSCTEVSSTCELLYKILMKMPGIDGNASALPPSSAKSILTGITTDTNNFANSVFPDTLRITSELLAAGVDRDAIIQSLFFNYPERRMRAMGFVLSRKMTILPCGLAYIILNKHDLAQFKLREGDTEGFVNLPLSIDNVKMSILLKQEQGTANVRVSIRSKEGFSARKMAMEHFHGGGHEKASGGKLVIGKDISHMRKAASYVEHAAKAHFAQYKVDKLSEQQV